MTERQIAENGQGMTLVMSLARNTGIGFAEVLDLIREFGPHAAWQLVEARKAGAAIAYHESHAEISYPDYERPIVCLRLSASSPYPPGGQVFPYEFIEVDSAKKPCTPCDGCVNYVGDRVEGGKLQGVLHCAMHPYGPDGEECPDREERDTLDSRRRKLLERHDLETNLLETRHQQETAGLEAQQQAEIQYLESEFSDEGITAMTVDTIFC